MRSRWLQRPYGDQGLLIHRSLYERGFKELPLMEDLDLVERLSQITRLRRIGLPLTTDGRRWDQDGALAQLAQRHAASPMEARASAEQLARATEVISAYQKPQR